MVKNFKCANLQGQSFSGLDLVGADFSYANIRGANFSNANLTTANFSYARAGLHHYWINFLIVGAFILSALSGSACGFAGIIASGMLQPYFISFPEYLAISGVIVLATLAVYLIFTVTKGFVSGLVTMVVVLAALSAVVGTVFVILPGVGTGAFVMALAVVASIMLATASGIGVAIADAKIWTLFGSGGLALVVAGAVTQKIVSYLEKIVTLTASKQEAVELLRTKIGALNVSRALVAVGEAGFLGRVLAVVVAGTLVFLGTYIGWRSLCSDEKFTLTRRIIVALAATGGTNFRQSNLTDSNFSQASLENTDFRGANVTRTDWSKARGFDRARVGVNYLQDPRIRHLVITRNGENQKFDGLFLRGVNLSGATLMNTSFIGCDLSESWLHYADLSRANLVQTQLDQADLTGAILTGACIQDWRITRQTKLDEVKCDYVFMRHPTSDDPNRCRKPDDWKEVFADGDFADFINPLTEVLDLYHSKDVDPRAIAIAFNQLTENHPESEIEIVAMERRGKNGDKFLLKVKTAVDVDRSQMEEEYFSAYDQIKADNLLSLIDQKDNQTRLLVELLSMAIDGSLFDRNIIRSQINIPRRKRVTLKLNEGSFKTGFSVTLQIGVDGAMPSMQIRGKLSPNEEIQQLYDRWRSIYRNLVPSPRIRKKEMEVPNVSRLELDELACKLKECINIWLNQNFLLSGRSGEPIKAKLQEKIKDSETEIGVIIETEDSELRSFPWHLWDWFETYHNAEYALSTSTYELVGKVTPIRDKARILAVLGDSEGIDVEEDRRLLNENFPDAEIIFLPEPTSEELDNHLRHQLGWDIFCYSGHSESLDDGKIGKIYINKTESLTIDQLKDALGIAIKHGLRIGIFNSCDGLGLAWQLADLNLPQIIVMREAVPDVVAQEFLKNFLKEFASGQSFGLAVRRSREELQNPPFRDEYPCPSWLPIICQNQAEILWTWKDIKRMSQPGITEWLAELQAAIIAEENLESSDKAEILEKVQNLASLEKNSNNKAAQNKAQKAIWFLKGIFSELPSSSPLLKKGSKLLPAIAQALDLNY